MMPQKAAVKPAVALERGDEHRHIRASDADGGHHAHSSRHKNSEANRITKRAPEANPATTARAMAANTRTRRIPLAAKTSVLTVTN